MPSTCRNRAQSSEIEHGSEIEHQEPNLGYDSKRNRGFKRCVTECTGHYSQTAARRSGFRSARALRIETSASTDGRCSPRSNPRTLTRSSLNESFDVSRVASR
jgi:hypothetical protein